MSRVTVSTKHAYCVYTHSHNGIVFYVGKGRPYRPFDTSRRKGKWVEFVRTLETFDVEIVLWTSDNAIATQEEARLIREFRPCCNQYMNGYANAERRLASSHANTGKVISLATRQKISTARKGHIPNGWEGHSHTEESKQKIRASQHCIPIVCIETGDSFPSIAAAAKALSISKTNIRLHLQGRYRHVSGYTFQKLA